MADFFPRNPGNKVNSIGKEKERKKLARVFARELG